MRPREHAAKALQMDAQDRDAEGPTKLGERFRVVSRAPSVVEFLIALVRREVFAIKRLADGLKLLFGVRVHLRLLVGRATARFRFG